MQLLALQDIGDGLKSAMRMVGCAERLFPAVGYRPNFVEHQERIDLIQPLRRHRPADEEARPLALLVGGDDALNIALVH